MTTWLPELAGVTEVTWLVTVPCPLDSFSWYTQVFPTAIGKKAGELTVPLAEEAAGEPAAALAEECPDAEPGAAAGELALLVPHPATARAAAPAATTAMVVLRRVKAGRFMACLSP